MRNILSKGSRNLMSQVLEIHSKHSCPAEKMEKHHTSGQRIILNGSSVFYFLENRKKSPLQCLFTKTLSRIRKLVFSPKILSKTKKKHKSMLKIFQRKKIPTKEAE